MTKPAEAWPKLNKVQLEFEELRSRLAEAEQTLQAIRDGEVDALVVNGARGQQVYTLRGADQAYRVFVEQMQEGAATASIDGTILYANARLAEMLQVPLEKLIGTPLAEVIDPSCLADLDPLLARADEGAAKQEMVLASPAHTPALVSVSTLADEEAFYSLVFTDITDRKQGAEISAAERMARSILDNAAEAIVVCDRQGQVFRANAQAERLAQRTELCGKLASIFDFHGANIDSETGLPTDLLPALGGQVVRGWEVTVSREGGTADLLISAGPLSGPDEEQAAGCVVTMTDITERNAAFRAVKELNETLEERVASRTAQLEAANRELEGFCYSVSHDLRAPLRGIMGSAMILIEDHAQRLDTDAKNQLERLGVAAKTMGSLIDDLLQFSRLTRRVVKSEDIDLTRLAEDIASERQREPAYSHAKVTVEAGLSAKGDRELIRMALENLIENALKFSMKNPEAEVFVGRADGKNTYVVRDNGVGFEQQYVEKIFMPFERLHTANDFPGTGIGLANVQRIITRHEGKIWAEGEVGHGAAFYFTLP